MTIDSNLLVRISGLLSTIKNSSGIFLGLRKEAGEILVEIGHELHVQKKFPSVLTVEEFRREVRDKLGVVFNGSMSMPLSRACARQQCEDFLVERYEEALRK